MSVPVYDRKPPVWMYASSLLLLLAAFTVVAVSPAQETSRRVVARSAPTYPELAKKMHLSGKVKIEVEVSPAGSVTSAKMVGGNPVFETSAVQAVKQWKFETAASATKGVITVEFTEQ